ncbi:MAG: hypothetical protein AMXMBFR84_01730 [Candidatus Hydrogenedentota bacterium]
MTSSENSATLGVVIVDHGSKLPAANRLLEDVAVAYRRITGTTIVEPAHMELAEPTIAQALSRCIEQGATEVAVALFFLSPGRHSTSDIPRIVEEAAERFPTVPCYVTEPIGLDRAIIEVMQRRIEEAVRNPRQRITKAGV